MGGMSLPRIAIVGRPNVGKSSLLNRLAKRRVSIVDPTPGVTRDRVSVVLDIEPPSKTPKGTESRLVEVHDTGGWGVYVVDGEHMDDAGNDLRDLTSDIEFQIKEAMNTSDLIIYLVDAQSGITPLDQTVAKMLRRSGVAENILLVNKSRIGTSLKGNSSRKRFMMYRSYCPSNIDGSLTTIAIVGGLIEIWETYKSFAVVPSLDEGPRSFRIALTTAFNFPVVSRCSDWAFKLNAMETASLMPCSSTALIKTIGAKSRPRSSFVMYSK